jgi:UDP-N-acetylglucosamine 2-epimerase (non-hydrolysing)
MRQVIATHKKAIVRSRILKKLRLRAGRYFVVSAHREENVDDPSRLRRLLQALGGAAETFKLPMVVSTHPRTRARIEALGAKKNAHRLIQFVPPMGFADYICLQTHAACVLSDSGTLTEEASLLGFPGVMLREAHERPEGMDEGTVAMAGIDPERVSQAVAAMMDRHKEGRRPRVVADYDTDDVASKVVNAILSYTDYVKRVVWRER